MKCVDCPLVKLYSGRYDEDGELVCLVTGWYVEDGGGCTRTNKWILSQDKKKLIESRQEEEAKMIERFLELEMECVKSKAV